MNNINFIKYIYINMKNKTMKLRKNNKQVIKKFIIS